MQSKLVTLQRLQHVAFQLEALTCPLLHRLIESLEARLTRLLGAVKRQVGGLQGILQPLPGQQRRNTNTGADHQATLAETQRFAQRGETKESDATAECFLNMDQHAHSSEIYLPGLLTDWETACSSICQREPSQA